MKAFLPRILLSLFTLCLLFFCNTLFAQSLQPAPWNDPAITWLAPAQAQVEVQNKLDQLEPQLAGYIPGTGQHTDLLRKILFYKSILLNLVNGMQVRQAVEAAVPVAASLGGIYEQAFTPEATLRDLFDEALALLSN